MIIKTKPSQVEQINMLVRTLCCNCIDENCILLDDGEEHHCVQLLCVNGIYCNYFKRSVLPADKELYEEIINQNKSDLR